MSKDIYVLVFTCLFALSLSAVSCAQKEIKKMTILDSIPMKLKELEPGQFMPYVQVKLDGNDVMMGLDTGAKSSSIVTHKWSTSYKSESKGYATGVSGDKTPYDVIKIKKITFGKQLREQFSVERRKSDLFGLDLIDGNIFELNFEKKKLNLLGSTLSEKLPLAMQILPSGHLFIPLQVVDSKINAVFDTGATATIVDTKFIKENPSHFELIGSEMGKDGHSGSQVPSEVYKCKSITIGGHKFSDVKVVSFEFPIHLRKAMKGSPMILGTNVMMKANWIFDIKGKAWSVDPL